MTIHISIILCLESRIVLCKLFNLEQCTIPMPCYVISYSITTHMFISTITMRSLVQFRVCPGPVNCSMTKYIIHSKLIPCIHQFIIYQRYYRINRIPSIFIILIGFHTIISNSQCSHNPCSHIPVSIVEKCALPSDRASYT